MKNKKRNRAVQIFPDSIIFNFNFFLVLYCFYYCSIDFQLEGLIYRVVAAV